MYSDVSKIMAVTMTSDGSSSKNGNHNDDEDNVRGDSSNKNGNHNDDEDNVRGDCQHVWRWQCKSQYVVVVIIDVECIGHAMRHFFGDFGEMSTVSQATPSAPKEVVAPKSLGVQAGGVQHLGEQG